MGERLLQGMVLRVAEPVTERVEVGAQRRKWITLRRKLMNSAPGR